MALAAQRVEREPERYTVHGCFSQVDSAVGMRAGCTDGALEVAEVGAR